MKNEVGQRGLPPVWASSKIGVTPMVERPPLVIEEESGKAVFHSNSVKSLRLVLQLLCVEIREDTRGMRTQIRCHDDAVRAELFGDEAPTGFQGWFRYVRKNRNALFTLIEENALFGGGPDPQGKPKPLRKLKYGRDLMTKYSDAIIAANSADSFREWLDELPEWDRTSRIDQLLTRLFGAEDDELTRWASRYPLIGAVERAVEPGAKMDEVPILYGAQDCGKSTFLSRLLPCFEWFSDHLSLDGRAKEQLEAIQGRVIVEISEMSGATRADLQKLKRFITQLDDGGTRLAYREDPEDSPRRWVMVGTSNDNQTLPNDTSGLRRFVPITLPRIDPDGSVARYMDENREQLWAEALVMYESGVRTRLPFHLKPQAAEHAEDRRSRDELPEDWVEANHDKIEGKTFLEIYRAAEWNENMRGMQARVRKALKGAGYVPGNRRVPGKKQARRYWMSEDGLSASAVPAAQVEQPVERPRQERHIQVEGCVHCDWENEQGETRPCHAHFVEQGGQVYGGKA